MKKIIFIVLLLPGFCTKAYSQAAVGQSAPPITVEQWLKGEAVSNFQNGKVYLVEFWGTWCGPCVKNIPHLSELQKKYSAAGLSVIGVASHEFDGRGKLDEFMRTRGNEMEYTVAYDSDQSMERDWDTGDKSEMTFKLPVCFLVDKNGKVVFIGHPENKSLEDVLQKTLDE